MSKSLHKTNKSHVKDNQYQKVNSDLKLQTDDSLVGKEKTI